MAKYPNFLAFYKIYLISAEHYKRVKCVAFNTLPVDIEMHSVKKCIPFYWLDLNFFRFFLATMVHIFNLKHNDFCDKCMMPFPSQCNFSHLHAKTLHFRYFNDNAF